jgi:hypothetical protein
MGGLISSSLVGTLHVNAEPISHGLEIDTAIVHVNPHVNPHVNLHAVDPVVVHTNPEPADAAGGYLGDVFGDNDGDGVPNFIDPTPDGSPHPKFTNVHVDLVGPIINDPGVSTGDPTPPPPDGGDHTPPMGDGDGGHHDSPPVDSGTPLIGDVPAPETAPQQPIMLADDALAKPVAPQGNSGSGEEALIIGGAAFAGGAIAGGVAGSVLNRSKSTDDER